MRILTTVLLAAIVGCGTEEKGAETKAEIAPTSTAQLIDSIDQLQECGESIKGNLVYVVSESGFKYCDGTDWADIDLRGSDGADGSDTTVVAECIPSITVAVGYEVKSGCFEDDGGMKQFYRLQGDTEWLLSYHNQYQTVILQGEQLKCLKYVYSYAYLSDTTSETFYDANCEVI